MERFKVKSKALTGEKAKDTIKTIAYTLAKSFDLDVVGDVLGAITTGLDGGPERWGAAAQNAIIYINNNKDILRDVAAKELLHARIEDFVKESQGWMSYTILDKELNIVSPKDKVFRRKIIARLAEKGLIEKHKTQGGLFHRVENQLEELKWWEAENKGGLDLHWPFELEKKITIYPKSIIVIAGTKDSGKTTMALNFIEMNMDNFPIHYFSSEMGKDMIHTRLSLFDGVPIDAWRKVKMYPRTRNFAPVIFPDAINVIDFYEITDNFFSIGGEFIDIFEKLNNGIAVIALQKDYGKDLGRGASFSIEKAALYLSLEKGTMKIISAKSWVNPDKNPVGYKYHFKLLRGHKLLLQRVEDPLPF